MSLRLGTEVPDFEAASTAGPIKLHEYIEGSWAILFSHPRDYTPVCTTELGEAARRAPQFAERGVKLLALSCDDPDSHAGWIADIKAHTGQDVAFPIVADPERKVAVAYGMLDPEEKDAAGMPVTVRAVFVIGPDKKVKLTLTYPPPVGRNFDEIVRVVDALQRGAKHSVATPVNWVAGGDVMVLPSVSDEAATEKFGSFTKAELPSGKGYIRTVADPGTGEGK